jgi:hypothetical protein
MLRLVLSTPTKTLKQWLLHRHFTKWSFIPDLQFVTTYTQKDDAPLPLNTDVAAAVPWDLTALSM